MSYFLFGLGLIMGSVLFFAATIAWFYSGGDLDDLVLSLYLPFAWLVCGALGVVGFAFVVGSSANLSGSWRRNRQREGGASGRR